MLDDTEFAFEEVHSELNSGDWASKNKLHMKVKKQFSLFLPARLKSLIALTDLGSPSISCFSL